MTDTKSRNLKTAWLAVALGLAAPASALAQAAERDCTVPKEPNGMVRGDRVPAGCVLRSNYKAPQDTLSDWPHPYIVCNEKFFYTPTVKKSVLANCVALARGGMIIPTVPFSGVYEPRDFGSLGPFDRHFGSGQRHFGATQRNFGRAPGRYRASKRQASPARGKSPKR